MYKINMLSACIKNHSQNIYYTNTYTPWALCKETWLPNFPSLSLWYCKTNRSSIKKHLIKGLQVLCIQLMGGNESRTTLVVRLHPLILCQHFTTTTTHPHTRMFTKTQNQAKPGNTTLNSKFCSTALWDSLHKIREHIAVKCSGRLLA